MTYTATPKVTISAAAPEPPSRANRRIYFALAGGILLALLGGAGLKLMHNRQADVEVYSGSESLVEGAPPMAEPLEASFESPFFQATSPIQLADPGLLRSTSSQARIETVASGRPDPFAPLMAPTRVTPRPASVPVPPAPVGLSQPLPVVPVAATQSLPPLPQPASLPSLPAPYVPGSQPPALATVEVPGGGPSSQNLADQVAVTGVVQVGNRVYAIISEPGSSVGRRVSQGEAIAGGRMHLKTIDMSGPEPIVILTYNGREYPFSVGSSNLVGSL